jgi:hypothetical protein
MNLTYLIKTINKVNVENIILNNKFLCLSLVLKPNMPHLNKIRSILKENELNCLFCNNNLVKALLKTEQFFNFSFLQPYLFSNVWFIYSLKSQPNFNKIVLLIKKDLKLLPLIVINDHIVYDQTRLAVLPDIETNQAVFTILYKKIFINFIIFGQLLNLLHILRLENTIELKN